MEIYDVLRKDHKAVAALFEQIEMTTERALKGRKDLFASLRDQLLAHAHAEQDAFYKPLLARVEETREDRDLLLEAFEEHRVLELVFGDIDGCPVDDERWLSKVTVLREIVEHHVEEEERELFALAREHFSKEESEEIARQMQIRRDELIG